MTKPTDNPNEGQEHERDASPDDLLTETDAEREEIIDALLQPDRSHHDELGRTVERSATEKSGKSSPREQAPAPIDITNVDE